jgi:hypothetical protein
LSDLGGPDADSLPWLAAGIRGVARNREWDAVATIELPELSAGSLGELELRVRADGTPAPTAGGVPPEAVERVLAALRGTIEPPYMVQGVRQDEVSWSLGAIALSAQPIDLPHGLAAGSIELVLSPDGDVTAYADGERVASGPGNPELTAALEKLERTAAERFKSYVARADRVGVDRWEVTVDPL